ncbi:MULTISPECIES: lysozyme inhibitor LprI family protein [unclassified Pseudovibrio]|uniref:lysozyme inhibitor LprI family protein n=1 Tax=unclassified Pseudovibrio TaxID=2627060 RepID=UPI000186B592|nr:lysozyme inhibitor LprI family protein [Pseudovibrio sp. JE062]EEA95578.1 hypothetical protein PJE062_4616 [Pseudovibrio sp. JE062]
MIIRCLVFLAFLSSSAVALAQGPNQPRADEIKVFHECLQKGGLVFTNRVQCIGKVFEHCAMKLQDQTSMGMRECYSRETALWEKMISNSEKELRRNENKATKTELVESTRNWKAFRNNACNIPFAMNPKGTLAPVLGMECFNRITALWALQLSEFATPLGD